MGYRRPSAACVSARGSLPPPDAGVPGPGRGGIGALAPELPWWGVLVDLTVVVAPLARLAQAGLLCCLPAREGLRDACLVGN